MEDLQQITESSYQVIQFIEKYDTILHLPFLNIWRIWALCFEEPLLPKFLWGYVSILAYLNIKFALNGNSGSTEQ